MFFTHSTKKSLEQTEKRRAQGLVEEGFLKLKPHNKEPKKIREDSDVFGSSAAGRRLSRRLSGQAVQHKPVDYYS